MHLCACVQLCVCVYVRAHVCACVHAYECVCVSWRGDGGGDFHVGVHILHSDATCLS